MKESILIFGAGLNQLTLIQAAKELGVISIAIDPNPNPPGKELADYFFCVEADDYGSTKNIALKYNVQGIVTAQMENPLRLMARLADDLGFVFHSPRIIERCLNKFLMKQAFLEHNIPCAKGVLLKKDEDFTMAKLEGLNFPIIIKPLDSYSSRGVFKIDSKNKIPDYIDLTRGFSSTGDILFEEFLEGKEYSIESITFNRDTQIVQHTEKFINTFPNTVEMGHLQPAGLSNRMRQKINIVVKKVIEAIGIDNSASHCEIKLTPAGPKVIEIGARLGGDFISSYLTQNSCGINMDKAAIQVALGKKPDLKPTKDQYSYIKYIKLPPGNYVKKIYPWNEINKDDDLIISQILINEGQIVPKITHSGERPGFVIVKGESRADVIKKGVHYEKILHDKIVLNKEAILC